MGQEQGARRDAQLRAWPEGECELLGTWGSGGGGARFPPPPQGSPAHPSQKVKVERRLEQQRSGLFDTKC